MVQGYDEASALLDRAKARGLMIATAESCTGGLIAATLAAVPGASVVLERGFITYSNEAKADLLGIPAPLIVTFGAVSREVSIAMASGALERSRADIVVAVTGVAGPGGGTAFKPVGLVHIAAHHSDGRQLHQEHRFGDIGRHEIQAQTVLAAFALITQLLD